MTRFIEACLQHSLLLPLDLMKELRKDIATLPADSSGLENILEFFEVLSFPSWYNLSSRSPTPPSFSSSSSVSSPSDSAPAKRLKTEPNLSPSSSSSSLESGAELLEFLLVLLNKALVAGEGVGQSLLLLALSILEHPPLFASLRSLPNLPSLAQLPDQFSALSLRPSTDLLNRLKQVTARLLSPVQPAASTFATLQAMLPGSSVQYFLSCVLTLSLDMPTGSARLLLDQLQNLRRFQLGAAASPRGLQEEVCSVISQTFYGTFLPSSAFTNFVYCVFPGLLADLGFDVEFAVRAFKLQEQLARGLSSSSSATFPVEAALRFNPKLRTAVPLQNFLENALVVADFGALDSVVQAFLNTADVTPITPALSDKLKELVISRPHFKIKVAMAILTILERFCMYTSLMRVLAEIGVNVLRLGDLLPQFLGVLVKSWDFWIDKKGPPAHRAVWDLLYVGLSFKNQEPHLVTVLREHIAKDPLPGRLLFLTLLSDRLPSQATPESIRSLTQALLTADSASLADRESPAVVLNTLGPTLASISTYYQETRVNLEMLFRNLKQQLLICPYVYPLSIAALEQKLVGPETNFAIFFMKNTVCTTVLPPEHTAILGGTFSKIITYLSKEFDPNILAKLNKELPPDIRFGRTEFTRMAEWVTSVAYLPQNAFVLKMKRTLLVPARDLLPLILDRLLTVPADGQRSHDFTKRACKFVEFSVSLLDWSCRRIALDSGGAHTAETCSLVPLLTSSVLPQLAARVQTTVGAQLAAYFVALLASHHSLLQMELVVNELGRAVTLGLQTNPGQVNPRLLFWAQLNRLLLSLEPADTTSFPTQHSPLLALLEQFLS